jgi:hypothetical protein
MNLVPLANRLQTANVGINGKSIFVNMMPTEASLAVLLRTRLSGTAINYELPGYFKTEFQVIVRSHDVASGATLMSQVIASLTLNETQVETIYFKFSRPKTKPVIFPLSKGNYFEYNVYFETVYVE